MLRVEHLQKSYGSRRIIDDLSFSAEKGKIYAFLGPNGVGKSTTMNMITGYLAPGGGDILVGDVSMLREPGKAKRQIGYLPEVPPLYPDMTVTEYPRAFREGKEKRGGQGQRTAESGLCAAASDPADLEGI